MTGEKVCVPMISSVGEFQARLKAVCTKNYCSASAMVQVVPFTSVSVA